MLEYFDKVLELKEKYYGNQDEYLNQNSKFFLPKPGHFLEKREIEPTGNKESTKLRYFIKPKTYEHLQNFRVNEKNIKSINLDCGGARIDNIISGSSKNISTICDILRYIYQMEGLPFSILKQGLRKLKYHEWILYIEYIEDTNVEDKILTYDVYNIDKEEYLKFAESEQLIFQIQYNQGYRIWFNHPEYYLISDHQIKKILFDGNYELELSEYYQKNGYYIYKFIPTEFISNENPDDIENVKKYGINFSKIDITIAILNDKSSMEDNNNIYIYAIGVQILNTYNGMAGLRYSK